MNPVEREVIVEVLCNLAIANDFGDVRQAEVDLWKMLGVTDLKYTHGNNAWENTRDTLIENGMADLIPEEFKEDGK